MSDNRHISGTGLAQSRGACKHAKTPRPLEDSLLSRTRNTPYIMPWNSRSKTTKLGGQRVQPPKQPPGHLHLPPRFNWLSTLHRIGSLLQALAVTTAAKITFFGRPAQSSSSLPYGRIFGFLPPLIIRPDSCTPATSPAPLPTFDALAAMVPGSGRSQSRATQVLVRCAK